MPDKLESRSDARVHALLRETERKLHRQNQVVVDLARRRSVQTGELDLALREIAEAAADTLEVDRVSVWFFSEDRMKLRCAEEFVVAGRQHLQGAEVLIESSPVYFHVLERERTISVHDASQDPRMAAMTEETLRSSGVRSTIDAPIRRLGRVTGVVRHTAMARRHWAVDEENFAASIADLIVIAIDAAEQRNAQRSLEHRLEFERAVSRISTRMINVSEEELSEAIHAALGSIGSIVGADRAYVVLRDPTGDTASMRHEWCAPGIDSHIANVQKIPVALFTWMHSALETTGPLRIEDVRNLPAEASVEKAFLESLKVRALLAIPIAVQKDVFGLFGVVRHEETNWKDETVGLLRVVAEIIGSAIARSHAEQSVRESESRYRLLAENATDLISRLDARGTIRYASPAVESLLGYKTAGLEGRSIFDFISADDHEVVRLATRTLARRGTMTFSFRVRNQAGAEIWFEATCRGIRHPKTKKMTEIVSVSRDITARKRIEDHIAFQAYHDDLTRLPNRVLFRDRLTVALAYARRTRRPLAVLFMDLDRFKVVNDTLGHIQGDELLKVIASRLTSAVRAEDSVARMGGDEFTVLATNLATSDDASLVAQKLIDALAQPVTIEDHDVTVTTSIGIAVYPDDGDTADLLLKNADNAMYRAKESGRNTYKLCTPEMNRRASARLTLEAALRHAVERQEFFLIFEPVFRASTMEIAGFEALLRWNRPGHGTMEPSDFIGIAEETRMIAPLASWMLEEACRSAKAWQVTRPGTRVSMNLTLRQFQNNDLAAMIGAAVNDSGLDPSLLELEISEGVANLSFERATAIVKSLRDTGVHIGVDGFGSGFSSLNYLRALSIDAVKIDPKFVAGIDSGAGDRAIIAGVVAMVRSLGLRVTAEGVTTQAQLGYLRSAGCDELQGPLLGEARRTVA